MLKHHADAKFARGFWVGDGDALAVPADLTRVGLHDAVDHLHQRRFSRAVFAQKRVDFTGAHRKADLIIGKHAGEPFGNARKIKAGRRLHRARIP